MANEINTDYLTPFFREPEIRRGPKTELSDPQLENVRDRLIRLFEDRWGELGYKLRKCKNSQDISNVFTRLISKPHESGITYVLTIVCRATGVAAKKAQLRKIKAELRNATKQRYDAGKLLEGAHRLLQDIDWAMNAEKKSEYRLLRRERKRRRKEYAKASLVYRKFQSDEQYLTDTLHDLQPSFASTELLKFLQGRRYELNPVNLASAMAGFPDIGWRRSILRCKRTKPPEERELYKIFKAVRYLVETATDKISKHSLSAHFRNNIRKLPYRHRTAQEKLAEHWRYIDHAIRQLPKVPLHPKEIPFKIMENYVKQFETYSHVNAVLAAQARIQLPKRSRRNTL